MPCSNTPSPAPPLGLSFHTCKMVIILSTPESEEELGTNPKCLKAGNHGHGIWLRVPISLQQLGLNHCARWAMRIVSRSPLRGCYCPPHFTDGKVNICGQTWKGQHIAWALAAKVLASQDLQERRAKMPGSEV